jgi:hypothetical protein
MNAQADHPDKKSSGTQKIAISGGMNVINFATAVQSPQAILSLIALHPVLGRDDQVS